MIREELARLFTWQERHRRLAARLLIAFQADTGSPRHWLCPHMSLRERRERREIHDTDGLFIGQITMPFVSYLNHVFSHGGFPGQTLPDNHWHRKQALAKDLLPL